MPGWKGRGIQLRRKVWCFTPKGTMVQRQKHAVYWREARCGPISNFTSGETEAQRALKLSQGKLEDMWPKC